jgi:hypothetical protein
MTIVPMSRMPNTDTHVIITVNVVHVACPTVYRHSCNHHSQCGARGMPYRLRKDYTSRSQEVQEAWAAFALLT